MDFSLLHSAKPGTLDELTGTKLEDEVKVLFQYIAKSDTGNVREVNEDRVAVIRRSEGLLLAILADGMGGHKAGDVASEMTVQSLSDMFLQADSDSFISADQKKAWLSKSVQQINASVFEHASTHPECKGMGTTLIAALIDNDDCVMCHIGDSRAYLIGDAVQQLTRDHSFVNALLDSGEISEAEAEVHPKKNWIVKALGTEAGIEEEILHFSLSTMSYLLICSDGLSNKVSKDEIAKIVLSTLSLSQKGEDLIELANHHGGEDNISLVLLSSKVEGG